MRHSRTRRTIAIGAGACLLVALGCGLFGLAVQQRVIPVMEINLALGPLSVVAHGPRSAVCPQKADPLANVCDRFSAIRGPVSYRIWLAVLARARARAAGHARASALGAVTAGYL
jgi:hypothetical protein